MEDEFYALPGEPVYHEKIRRIQNNDPVNAEEVLNPVVQALLDNAHFARLLAEALAAQNAADHTAIRQETAEAIAAIPTPDVSGQIGTHNSDAAAHSDIRGALENHQNDKSNPHGTTAAQVGARPDTWTPTAADVGASPTGHKHTKSEITDFPTSMPASDVPAWAKASSKPSYTASEVGARPSTWTPSAADVGAIGLDLAGNAAVPGILTVGGLPVLTVGAAASNQKLDNWYFADPINQRGNMVYTGAIYTIDRWRTNDPQDSIELKDDYIETHLARNSAFYQPYDFQIIENYTLSFLFGPLSTGTIQIENMKKNITGGGLVSATLTESGVLGFYAISDNNKADIIAAKLEPGNQQTLARKDASGNWILNDTPPNKALELAKCQRYQLLGKLESIYLSSYL